MENMKSINVQYEPGSSDSLADSSVNLLNSDSNQNSETGDMKLDSETTNSQKESMKEISRYSKASLNDLQLSVLHTFMCNPATYSHLNVRNQNPHFIMNLTAAQFSWLVQRVLHSNMCNSPSAIPNLDSLDVSNLSKYNREFVIRSMLNRTDLRQQLMVLNAQNELASFTTPLILSRCVVYPPYHQLASHEARYVCGNTVHVAGLPEMVTKEIIEEIFERCGRICDIEIHQRKCSVTFTNRNYARNAACFSGWTIKIQNREEHSYTGMLLIECLQWNNSVEMLQYSCGEPLSLMKRLDELTFEDALRMLKTWMKQGVCNAENSEIFFSRIQKASCHIGLLMNEIDKKEAEISQKKLKLKKNLQDTLVAFDEIEKIFNPVCMKNIWKYFDKKQKVRLKLMQKHYSELKSSAIAQLTNLQTEEESDENIAKEDQLTNLQTEEESDENIAKEDQLTNLQTEEESVENIAKEDQLTNLQTEKESDENIAKEEIIKRRLDLLNEKKRLLLQLKEKREQLCAEREKNIALRRNEMQKISKRIPESEEFSSNKHFKENNPLVAESHNSSLDYSNKIIGDKEASLISLISVYLSEYPTGANLSDIISHLQQIDSNIMAADVENLVRRLPSVFVEVPGTESEKKIKFFWAK